MEQSAPAAYNTMLWIARNYKTQLMAASTLFDWEESNCSTYKVIEKALMKKCVAVPADGVVDLKVDQKLAYDQQIPTSR